MLREEDGEGEDNPQIETTERMTECVVMMKRVVGWDMRDMGFVASSIQKNKDRDHVE
jgi:hypothetical protein